MVSLGEGNEGEETLDPVVLGESYLIGKLLEEAIQGDNDLCKSLGFVLDAIEKPIKPEGE